MSRCHDTAQVAFLILTFLFSCVTTTIAQQAFQSHVSVIRFQAETGQFGSDRISSALDKFAAANGFEPTGPGVTALFAFYDLSTNVTGERRDPAGAQLIRTNTSTIVSIELWKSSNDPNSYDEMVTKLKQTFVPLGLSISSH